MNTLTKSLVELNKTDAILEMCRLMDFPHFMIDQEAMKMMLNYKPISPESVTLFYDTLTKFAQNDQVTKIMRRPEDFITQSTLLVRSDYQNFDQVRFQ